MVREVEKTESSLFTLKLPILHITSISTTMYSPEHQSGTSTPPLQTCTASIPFKWEEHPGKPRPCTDIIIPLQPSQSLDLPPCRLPLTDPPSKITKTPSPTSILDGPYNVARPKFSSFRFFREGKDSCNSNISSVNPDEGIAMGVLLGSKKNGKKGRGFFGKFKGGKKEGDGGSIEFSPNSTSSFGSEESWNSNGRKMRRNGSFSSIPHATSSHLLASIYEGLKQVIQWKSSRKSKREGQD